MTSKTENYAASICKYYPDLIIERAIVPATEGQFNEILFVNHDLVFRFPRSAQDTETLALHVEILKRIRPYLSLAIPNPLFAHFEPGQHGYAFMGYPLLPANCSGPKSWKRFARMPFEIILPATRKLSTRVA